MGRKRSGFTLIELLVVIAIIAILAAILFPIFMKAKESGKRVACVGNLKQLGTAFRMYEDDYGAFPGQNTYAGNETAYAGWLPRVYKYAKNTKVFQCPDAIQQWSVSVQIPGEGSARTFKISYSYNEYLQWQNATAYPFAKESSLRSPKDTAMVADGYQHALFHDWNDSGCWNDFEGMPSGMNRIRYSDGPKMTGGVADWKQPLVRHMGPNIVFCDLHVQQVNKEKFKAVNYPGASYPTTCKEYPVVYPMAMKFQ